MNNQRWCAWVVATMWGCGGAPPAAVDAMVTLRDATEGGDMVASDVPAPLTMFHGVAVRTWDRSMPDVDAIGYEIDLSVDESTPTHETYRAELRGVFVTTRALDAFTLDFEGNDLDATEVDGRPVRASREGAVLTVPFSETVPEGRTFALTVRYHGRLFQGTGADPNDFRRFGGLMVFQRNRAGRRIYESLNWPSKARRWLPLRDHPRDGVMVAVRATFPSTYTVLANGRMESMRDNTDATRTWQYFCATPMPAYDIHVAAYDDWAETTARSSRMQRTVRWLPYATDREAGMTLLGELPAAMDFYEDTFGPFRWEQAVFLEVPIFGGGMEHATLVSMDESLFRSPARNRSVTFHELAHHWSGNLVRIATWNDFWLSEGVTDYLTGRFIETHDGAEAGRLHWREYLRQSIVAEAGTARHAVRPPDPEVDVLSIFDSVSYKKGAFVLRMLERRIGTEAFTRFLRDWFTRHATQAVTTATLEEELTEAFAMADVPSFFRQWMYTPAHPVIALDTRYDAAAGAVTLTARQMQSRGPGDGFTLPVEVEFSRGDMRTRTTVMLSGRSTTHTTPLRFEPERVVVDPDETAYLAVACTAGVSPCREGYVCAAPTAGASTVCLPARM